MFIVKSPLQEKSNIFKTISQLSLQVVIFSFVHAIILYYLFGYNNVDNFINIPIIFTSLLVNTSTLKLDDHYPFFRHGMIYTFLFIILWACAPLFADFVNELHHVNILWGSYLLLTFVLSIVFFSVRARVRSISKYIEYMTISILIFLSFIIFEWQGALLYLLCLIPLLNCSYYIVHSFVYLRARLTSKIEELTNKIKSIITFFKEM